MKIRLLLLMFILIAGGYLLAQENTPDSIKNYPGIPIITYKGCAIDGLGGPYLTVDDFKYADSSGIFAMQLDNVRQDQFNTYIAPTNLKVMPGQIDITLEDFILTYTEGRYTEFQAEGTPPEDGLISLYNDSLDLFRGNGVVSTKTTTPHGTMIYGPMYRQCRNYVFIGGGDSIPYRASYILKIDDVDPWLDSSPEDTVCILQVTSTRTWDLCTWVVGADTFRAQYYTDFEATLVHADTVITYGDLQSAVWDTIHLDYSFGRDVPWLSPASNPYPVATRYRSSTEDMLDDHISQNCVEFKVIWKGKADKVKLSVDKIIVSDERGRDLKDPFEYPDIAQNILDQIDDYLSFTTAGTQSRSVGFIGIDEPWSLDQWEPIRMVNEIVDAYRPNGNHFELYYQFNVQSFGRFSWPEDPARGSHVMMIDEFMKRVGKANVWITGWLYDVPCDGLTPDPPCAEFIYPRPICNQAPDFRVVNIDHMADSIYKRVLQASELYPGLYYGMSTQTGRYHPTVREINSSELLYTNNLALMYGAKLLSPWLYFTWDYPWNQGSYTGISNLVAYQTHELTDKYWTLRDTIAPRLSNLMGKTLKKLKPVKQFAGSNGIDALIYPQELTTPYEYVKSIQTTGGMNDECFVELGIFQDLSNTSAKYFMPINRYYSNKSILTFNLRYLTGYNNWQIYDYVDTTHISVVSINGAASFVDTIFAGDAKLYSVIPVVQNGGVLSENEYLTSDVTLKHDMLIDTNTELTISPDFNYTVKDTITLLEGSFITGDGYITLDIDAAIQINDWSKGVFRSAEDNHPKIIWGAYSAAEIVSGYNIYRKWNQEFFSIIGSTDESTFQFLDEDVEIYVPAGEDPKNAEYYVTAIINIEESSEESNPSNTIDYWVDKAGKMNTGVNSEEFVYELGQNYPNPFNPTTLITYGIKNNGFVTLKIYDIIGREIKTLVNDYKDAGNYNINFDASDLASGIYIYQLKAGDFISSKKMTLVK